MQGNSLMVLRPYLANGMWVFDDEATGLVREPFVHGIPEIIEDALENAEIPIEEAAKGFQLVFSKNHFPGAQVILHRNHGDRFNETNEGNWYTTTDGREGWLCPALFHYFQEAPDRIYCSVARSRTTKRGH